MSNVETRDWAEGETPSTIGLDLEPQTYILRLWPVTLDATVAWRCSLENVTTHARANFADVATLTHFLLDSCAPTPEHIELPMGPA